MLCGPEAPPPRGCTLSGRITADTVVAESPHDPQDFTQGLAWRDGRIWESTGLYGASKLRRWHPDTGALEAEHALSREHFGEGLAWDSVHDRLVQLTWNEQIALLYGPSMAPQGSFTYTGEGWGLCFDGEHLHMSDGSHRLTRRDAATFEVLSSVAVTWQGRPVTKLNELECIGKEVWANRWETNEIYRIDPATGRATGRWLVEGLLTPQETAQADVLNGLVFDPERRWLGITGKLWPRLFWVSIDDLVPPSH